MVSKLIQTVLFVATIKIKVTSDSDAKVCKANVIAVVRFRQLDMT